MFVKLIAFRLNLIRLVLYFRHSVDSVASYSSQNHVDRIRTHNFSTASCQDDSDFGSIKTSLFRRSSSNLEYPAKRPDSVTSNTSSTRSRLRELVERKSSQDEHRSGANPVVDIQYFENPTETLEFDSPRNSLDSRKNQDERPKKRKLSKSKEQNETKNKKQEKYQSKLADYYKLPVQLPQDEFYQHLTRSRAAEEFLQKRFPNSETEFSGSYGRLCKHREIEGSNLRRSRSLAVIREETFTDLQIQNHGKNKRSQLIPRARLFDKPCFKDRLTGRTKYQTKEEVLEGIYIDSTVSCFADINRQGQEESTSAPVTNDNHSEKEESICNESQHSKSANGSWANLTEDTKQINLSEDSIGHSRNPSEIDSLDSNYVRKHYNFEAHLKNYKDGSPDTGRSLASTSCKDLYIATDEQDSETECKLKSKTPISVSKERVPSAASQSNHYSEQDNFKDDDHVTYDKISIQSKCIDIKDNHSEIHQNCDESKNDGDNQSIISENDGTISSPPDSITSYISISIASSTEKSHKLEYLAHSLAEKIDEYCDSQKLDQVDAKSPALKSENQSEKEPIYTSVQKKKTFADLRRESFARKQNSFQEKINSERNDTYVSRTYIDSETYDRRATCASKNITTEPFVTTLIENQYYSLPDINISKCLRKSERIDAQLREEDPEDNPCENTYEVAQTHFREILHNKSNENYGQLNKSLASNTPEKRISHCTSIYLPEYSEPQILQNCTKLEDDLKSIITIESSNPDDNTKEFLLDNHQNEREINEIEGTIRNTKLVTKSESLKINSSPAFKQDNKILKSFSNDNIHKSIKGKTKTNIKKHYSLRQRDPDDSVPIPSPDTVIRGLKFKDTNRVFSDPLFAEEIKNHCFLSRVKSFKTERNAKIDIVPLSGHQTLVIDPPLNQSIDKSRPHKHSEEEFTTFSKSNNIQNVIVNDITPNITKQCETLTKEQNNPDNKDSFFTIKLNKVVKTNLQKLQADTCENIDLNTDTAINKPPSKLIIKDHKNYSLTRVFDNTNNNKMTRPQILQVVDSKNKKYNSQDKNKLPEKLENNYAKMEDNQENIEPIKLSTTENFQVKDKLDDAIKTDIEYQVKINSVKNYWSQLIDKSPDIIIKQEREENVAPTQCDQTDENVIENQTECSKPQNKDTSRFIPEVSVGKIIKTLENVKIVDSIRKISQTKLQLWKDESEKVKSDSEIEEPPVEKIIKEKVNNQNFYQTSISDKIKHKSELDAYRDTPEIEIVELSSDDNQNQKTQATLIKAKGYEKGCDDFDHVRYKVMKSELFKNSMIANYRKEAQFDGLLQYLQDYSFQELLTNNNIVIIEPVRTKVEPAPRKTNNIDPCKIHPSQLKKSDCLSQTEKTKNAIRRHFFYHPIRVNKEIIEEELPNPDTVKKVRNLFEDTLKMKSPMTQDPPILEDNTGLTRRSTSYRNLTDEVKTSKGVGRKKIIRQLTIDTNFGNKKWDNASLSSGVSSGDLSSNNEYEAEALSPYSNKNIKDNAYSSSEEYLCDSANQDFCCESQYVSPDILKKIRECGTSVTYYGGKVLNSKMGSNVSPMTKAIMEEIKSLQRNCSTNCYSCQTKCKGEKCACLAAEKHKQIVSEKEATSVAESESNLSSEKQLRTENFPGFKFKLVKSNSCSSRLELTGTDDNKNLKHKFRRQNSKDDPPLVHDEENSVKNKICRLESYSKGQIKTPIKIKNIDDKKKHQLEQSKNIEVKTKDSTLQTLNPSVIKNEERSNNEQESCIQKDVIQDKASNENHTFEKKFYYVNDNLEFQKPDTTGKFGEMVFEEFEVLENCYDSLNSNKSLK